MLEHAKAFNGFAVPDIEEAGQFYGNVLGLNVEVLDEQSGVMTLHLADGHDTLVYRKRDHEPGHVHDS